MLTDIVGSTALLSRIGDAAYLEVIEHHDQIMLAALRRHGGEVVRNMGDGMLVAFSQPATALSWIDEVHRSVLEQLGLGIRVGAHFGPAYVRLADYVGISIHVVARLGAMAGQGELLASIRFIERVGRHLDGELLHLALRGVDELTAVLSIRLGSDSTYTRPGGDLGHRRVAAKSAAG